jgi:hypothetical protein
LCSISKIREIIRFSQENMQQKKNLVLVKMTYFTPTSANIRLENKNYGLIRINVKLSTAEKDSFTKNFKKILMELNLFFYNFKKLIFLLEYRFEHYL